MSPTKSVPGSHALFPGSFDPFTLGHLDLVERGLALFGRVTIGIASHPHKQQVFDAEERVELAREATSQLESVEVALISGLLVAAARELGANTILRGVRGGADLDYEMQMINTNRCMEPMVDTVLLVPSPEVSFISSTLVRQIASMGGDVSAFVPATVLAALKEHFA